MGNKGRLKKVLAVILSAAMVMTSSTLVFAEQRQVSGNNTSATGTVSSDAEFEGYVDKEVFNVMVPVQDTSSTAFKFTMDPQDLIKSTSGIAYAAAEGIDKSKFDLSNANKFYFLSTNDAGTYSNKSQTLSVNNLSSVSVNVALTATITGLSGNITVSDNDSFTGVTTPAVALKLKAASAKGSVDSATGVYFDPTTKSAASDNEIATFNSAYQISWNSTDKYVYQLKSDADLSTASSLYFGLQGKCNSTDDADWSGVTAQDAKVGVVWNVTPVGAANITFANNVLSVPTSMWKGTDSLYGLYQSDVYGYSVIGSYVTVTTSSDPVTVDCTALAAAWGSGFVGLRYDGVTYNK